VTQAGAVLTLGPGVADRIIQHARETAPLECCGLLVGTPAHIDEAVPTRNVDPHRCRFQVDPGEHIRLNRNLRGTGRAVIGVYHSHPHGPAQPSASDIAEASYPEFAYLIVSLRESPPALVAYRLIGGIVSCLAIETEPAKG
jgi:proteasome lid subunit RPN8/RPN11